MAAKAKLGVATLFALRDADAAWVCLSCGDELLKGGVFLEVETIHETRRYYYR